MSSAKTETLKLNQWAPADYVSMGEFNDNFQKIDEAHKEVSTQLADTVQIYVESFTGTDTQKIQSAFDLAYTKGASKVLFGFKKTYLVEKPIIVRGNQIEIDLNRSVVTKTTDTIGDFTVPFEGITDDYNVNAVFMFRHEPNVFQEKILIKNGKITGDTTDNTKVQGIFAPRLRYLEISHIFTENCKYGYHTHVTYLSTFKNFNAYRYGVYGIYFHKNNQLSTTCNFIDCYTGSPSGNVGWYIQGLIYSSMVNCSSENAKDIAYYFEECNLNFVSCGTEYVYKTIFHAKNSTIDVNNLDVRRFTSSPGVDAFLFDNSVINMRNTKFTSDQYLNPSTISLVNGSSINFDNCIKVDNYTTIRKDASSGFTVISKGSFQSCQAERSKTVSSTNPVWISTLIKDTMKNSTVNNAKGAFGSLWFLTGNYQSSVGTQFSSYLLAVYKTIGGKYVMNVSEIGSTTGSSTTGALKQTPVIDQITGDLTIYGYDYCQYSLSRVDNLGTYSYNDSVWEWSSI